MKIENYSIRKLSEISIGAVIKNRIVLRSYFLFLTAQLNNLYSSKLLAPT